MSNIPEIRFVGFSDAWEQRKFGEVFVEYSEKNHDDLPPLTIIQGKGTILRDESDRNLIYDKSGLKNYKLVNENDFILHLRSFEGGLEKANSRGIVSPAYHIFNFGSTDPRFYYPFFRSEFFISVLLKPHVYGIRDGKSIDVEGMKSIDIPYPKIEEQNKIGDYFETLDNLITIHQRKCEKLKLLKSAMLEKMFPKNGASVPEIRLAGFCGEWEHKRLGECFTERTERSADGELIAVTINSGVIRASELNRHDNSSEDKSNYKVVRKNDIAYNSMRMWQGASGYSRYDGILSPAYTVAIPNTNISSIFFSYLFKRSDMIHQFQINSQGLTSDTWNLKFPAFSTIEVYVPTLDEQQKVADYFTNLDNLIIMHQRKYEKLKLFKTAMLEKMFPKGD